MLSATQLARTAVCVLTVSVPAWAQTVPARTTTTTAAAATRPLAGSRSSAPAATRGTRDVTRLGGTTRFYRGSLATALAVRQEAIVRVRKMCANTTVVA